MEKKKLAEFSIANTYKTDEEKLNGIREYYPQWLRTWCGKDEDWIMKETENEIERVKTALKGFGVNWAGIFYGSMSYYFIEWWGTQLDYYKQNYENRP